MCLHDVEGTGSIVLVDALGCVKRCVLGRAMLMGVSFARKIGRPSGHNSPCHGEGVKTAVVYLRRWAQLACRAKVLAVVQNGFGRARSRKASVLGEGVTETSILERMCGPPQIIFLDLSKAVFAQTSS
ncbi:hypothetical protein CDL15_Pgr004500 [Punica granatum]|uniref:Uncharacterized protein n=1 Tax=Punica granatum TaxID=22663 RepID=A0A218WZ47_PUNGR|nr:hypothetical protein CDL15_Pgr004500 [Punica granatum]